MASTSQILRALMSGDRLALVIALDPRAADVIPRGPQHMLQVARGRAANGGEEVELNPQPLPPGDPTMGAALLHKLAAAALASPGWLQAVIPERHRRLVRNRLATSLAEGLAGPGPRPGPVETAQLLLGGLLAAADISAHYDDPEMLEVFDAAIEMLGEAAVRQLNG